MAAHPTPHPAEHPRVDWLDSAKGLGIVLMFYGHFLQSGVAAGNATAGWQMKLIYAFHMPLFLLLAGCLYKSPAHPLVRLGQLARRRLLPVLFFAAVLLPFWLGYDLLHHQALGLDAMAQVAGDYLLGYPVLDWVTWFLVCLFVCEGLALLVLPHLHGGGLQLAFGLVCIAAGVGFSARSQGPADGLWYEFGRFWFFSEAVVALGFYTLGHAAYRWVGALAQRPRLARAMFVLSLAALLLTFQLNTTDRSVVMMAARLHGNVVAFAFTALAGSLAAVLLAMRLSGLAWLRWLGRNTVPLLGLNGVFFHFVDAKIGQHLAPLQSPLVLTLNALAVTAASLLVCVPLVLLLNRHLPLWVGASAPEPTRRPTLAEA